MYLLDRNSTANPIAKVAEEKPSAQRVASFCDAAYSSIQSKAVHACKQSLMTGHKRIVTTPAGNAKGTLLHLFSPVTYSSPAA